MSEVEKTNPVSRPASLAGRMITGKAHGKIHEVEKENSGVEAGHSIERTGERALSKSSGMAKTALRNHRLKPYREAAKAERALHKAQCEFPVSQGPVGEPKPFLQPALPVPAETEDQT